MPRTKLPIPASVVSKWHPEKNLPLFPEDLSAGSSKKIIHWICSQGHEWSNSVAHEVKRSVPCHQCAKFTPITDGSDLQTLYPDIASQWHPVKNSPLTPSMVTPGSRITPWWLGKCGHAWEASLRNRIGLHQGCPYCSGNRVLAGFNDLVTTHPDLAIQWHPEKNNILPTEVSHGSNRKVWWLGNCGHEWEAGINQRAGAYRGCPYCSGAMVLRGFNDLGTVSTHLIPEWDEQKNDTTPYDYTAGSGVKVWWKCSQGHGWKAKIVDRSKYGCPDCARLSAGKKKARPKNGSDLATVNPSMAAQWHLSKNAGLTPLQVNAGSSLRVAWICSKGHEWKAKISDRRFYKTDCPVCAVAATSRGHQAILDFLQTHDLKIVTNDRTVLNGKEIDIYLPEKNIGIEYNGVYWHSEEAGKDNRYHYNKWLKAQEKDIQLIQIWEDEWNANPNLIKAMLLHKLGLSQQEKIYARKTEVVSLTKKDIEEFLIANHIQGYASGAYYYGLKEKTGKERIVSVLVLKKESSYVLNIIRYATAFNVVGGFTKLISYAQKNIEVHRFITFSDHCVSDGKLYENNGFIADKQIRPDYRYIFKGKRLHKFGYRLERFRNDPNLRWEEGLTERELAKLNGLNRIWDAGKTRWVKDVSTG